MTSKSGKPLNLIILHKEGEDEPPSSPATLKHIIKVAKRHNINAELLTLDDQDLIYYNNYDAVFIRQTTYAHLFGLESRIYSFARLIQGVGKTIIDDPQSIEACCDKVEMHKRFMAAGLPTPKTLVISPSWDFRPESVGAYLGYPLVLKDPASCFSRGVLRANYDFEVPKIVDELTKQTKGPLLAQEFLPSSFDWRIGVLNGEVLYCCQYKMARGYWQIIKRYPDGHQLQGGHVVLKPHEHPEDVCTLAVQAANCAGSGLYGVDIKGSPHGPVIIEVNDNPSIDRGIEDRYGNVWGRIFDYFHQQVNGCHRQVQGNKTSWKNGLGTQLMNMDQ